MPDQQLESLRESPSASVLTLSEAASFLRVNEAALAEMAGRGEVPGQQIGGEWRFWKQALIGWLHLGPRFHELIHRHPGPWPPAYPYPDDLVRVLINEVLELKAMREQQSPPPGSRDSVRKHFGVFEQDDDLEDRLEELAAARKAAEGRR